MTYVYDFRNKRRRKKSRGAKMFSGWATHPFSTPLLVTGLTNSHFLCHVFNNYLYSPDPGVHGEYWAASWKIFKIWPDLFSMLDCYFPAADVMGALSTTLYMLANLHERRCVSSKLKATTPNGLGPKIFRSLYKYIIFICVTSVAFLVKTNRLPITPVSGFHSSI